MSSSPTAPASTPAASPIVYELAIIGGGPAGVAAAVYASRKKLRTVLVAQEFGGQSVVSDGIENWIGTIKIPGAQLAKDLEAHARAYADGVVDIQEGERATGVAKASQDVQDATGARFVVTTSKVTESRSYLAKAVLVAAGSKRRRLDVPGADAFEHKGITYCASCDGPVFSGQDVAVIGGGNAGFESAAQLLAYCKSVTIIHRNAEFKADPVTVEAVLKHPNMRAVTNAEIMEVKGDKFVTGIVYKDKATGAVTELPLAGVFVEIGAIPNTDFVADIVDRTDFGAIKVDPRTQRASTAGIWAAGDCTDALYHQNNIAAGDAVKALEDIYVALRAGA
jgi:alkyl hydroperoxide reductase subunit F